MSSPHSPIHLLHIDDDPMFLDLSKAFLEQASDAFEVDTIEDPHGVLTRLAEDAYDVVVSDYDMPGLTGIDLLKRVREIHPDLPFILFTGKGSEELASEAISAGVSDYVQKGGADRIQLLINRITNLVKQYRAETALKQYADQQRIVAELGTLALEETLETLFSVTVTQVSEGLDVEYCKILECGDDGELLLREGIGWDAGLVGRATIERGADSQAGYTLTTDEPVVVTDLTTDDRFRGPPLLIDHEVVSGISIVIGSPERPWGVLGAHTTVSRQFTDDDVIFVQSVANLLSAAIDRHEYSTAIELQTDLFEKAQDIANVGAWEWDVQTGDGFWTTQVDHIFGFNPGEEKSIERSVERFHPADRPTIETAFQQAIEAGEEYDLELRLIRLDGEQRWVRTRGEPQYVDGELVRVRGTIQDITAEKERELELSETVEFLHRGYKITTDTDASFETKLDRVLELGREVTGLPYGFLTAIDTDGDDESAGIQRILQAIGDHDNLRAGTSCPLEEAYCRRTIEQDAVLAVHDIVEAGWEDDVAYDAFALGSYIGVKVFVEDELYGTFCFASIDARDEPFSEAAKTMVELMGEWAGYELERNRAQALRTQADEQLMQFASVISHDLRSPLSIARGRAELAREQCESDHFEAVAEALDRTTQIIEELLSIPHQRGIDLQSVVLAEAATTAWEAVDAGETQLAVETDLLVWADPARLRQMLRNLFQNAVDHGGDGVTVTVGDLTDSSGFYVADNGVGLASEEPAMVFESGYTTSDGGIGIGLSIVESVGNLHGWTLRVTDSEAGGFRVEMYIAERTDG